MDVHEIGRHLRARRAASGRTVASVAIDAGLSVPYVANLENGRGNPTLSALSRLATALGAQLTVTLDPVDRGTEGGLPGADQIPQSLVRFGRTRRFRTAAAAIAVRLRADPDQLAAQLLSCLAVANAAFGREFSEPDYWRLLDALTLIALSPAS